MKILAFDTSTELCSAALYLDGEIRVREEMAGNTHSQLILPMINALLDEAGVKLKALDGLAFGKGPGSFTGLRIGCGIAQGLAFGAELPVVGISTLEALAMEAPSKNTPGDLVYSCIDARMNEVYVAGYQRTDGGWKTLIEPGVFKPDFSPQPEGDGWQGVGNGFAAYADALQQRLGVHLKSVTQDAYPHARGILELALPRFRAGDTDLPDQAEPLYVRDKVALKTCER